MGHTVTGRGRPRLADAKTLAARALSVLDLHGYRDCTMSDVAAEVGLSIRTLHRYFPTKADIVWGPVDTSFATLRRRLDETPIDVPLQVALRDGITASFADHDEDELTTRMRMRLIGRTPELHSHGSEPFVRWRQAITDFVATRTGSEPTALLAVVAGAAVQATTMSALTWWATHGAADDPVGVVCEALDALEVGFTASFAR
ncbi:TetR family transcriptional regulator [Microbacterium sp. LRZ72]|uniref:acyl-CoA-like ligand-binding transcription factor n=1 Tax=Microbacterium sp. LRZ72 TaxID=2942481 RepID=UPI0029B04A32|nr:TetR family transcriptional regulator [Microbacterium sp. LRZ72]MDX2377848.1 TetR family transcriptional regulator [Microbacterium sp. LRZ72]